MTIINTFKAKVRKFGEDTGTLFIHIPKSIGENLDIEKGCLIECSITKVNEEKVILQYKCKKCGYESGEEEYCPECGEDKQEEIK